MTQAQDPKKLELLKRRIESELGAEGENLEDLFKYYLFIYRILKAVSLILTHLEKKHKEKLLSDLKDIYSVIMSSLYASSLTRKTLIRLTLL